MPSVRGGELNRFLACLVSLVEERMENPNFVDDGGSGGESGGARRRSSGGATNQAFKMEEGAVETREYGKLNILILSVDLK